MRQQELHDPGKWFPLSGQHGVQAVIWPACRLSSFFEQSLLFPAPVALLLRLALVMQLLAARHRKFELGAAAIVEIDLERHHGHALALDSLGEPGHFPLVEQELAPPTRLVI